MPEHNSRINYHDKLITDKHFVSFLVGGILQIVNTNLFITI
jgi:hypothetical protein